MKMSLKMKKLADEFLICGNASEAARRAGYSPKYARITACKTLQKPAVREYIEARLKEIESEKIADQTEIMQYLTAVLRGESVSQEIVVEGLGDGCSEARRIDKAPSEKDRLKAAELLGKRYGLWTEKLEMDADMELNITIDYGDSDEAESPGE